jgi:2-oxoglutarate dehydrogenase E2 component (dihydrolipoamide succinyltransferase)
MISITVPPLGESIVEATVSRWLKREGDTVAAGETLVELETDKVTVEVPATTAGVLVRRAQQEGDVVGVGALLAELDAGAASTPAPSSTPGMRAETPVAPPPPAPAPGRPAPALDAAPVATPATSRSPEPDAFRASPAARRLASDSDVDLRDVRGTGRGGVVSKPDVVEFLSQPAAPAAPAAAPPADVPRAGVPATAPPADAPRAETPATAPPADAPRAETPATAPPAGAARVEAAAAPMPAGSRETREKMSTRRKRIAEHLLEAQHATAHLTTFNEIDMSVVEALRARVKDRIEKEHGLRLSFMPFFVRAACMALKQFPMVNARVDGDHIVFHHYVNMGIAVASEAGLVVPHIRDADRKGLLQIGRDIVAIAKKARDGKLTMDDLTGGTFTITNGGVFGSLLSTPIINHPQVGILGLHKLQDRAVVVDGAVVVRPMMYVALSYDHRIVDGQQAVLFLVRVKELMEDPALLAID